MVEKVESVSKVQPISDSPTANTLFSLASSCSSAAFWPALHWLFTSQPKVDSFKEARARGNLRFFSGRAAIGLIFASSVFDATASAVHAYDKTLRKL